MEIYHPDKNFKKIKAIKPFPGFLTVKFYRVRKFAKLPAYEYPCDVGMDLYADYSIDILPKRYQIINTGVAAILPKDTIGYIRPKMGLAKKFGILVLNAPDKIDCNYRGEIRVMLYNITRKIYHVERGQSIAELVISPYHPCHIEEIKELPDFDEKGYEVTELPYPKSVMKTKGLPIL